MPPGSYLIRGSCESTEAGCDTQGGTFECTSVCERVRVHMHACYCVCLDTHARTHPRTLVQCACPCVCARARAEAFARVHRHGARIKFNVQPAAFSPQHDSMKDGGNCAASERAERTPPTARHEAPARTAPRGDNERATCTCAVHAAPPHPSRWIAVLPRAHVRRASRVGGAIVHGGRGRASRTARGRTRAWKGGTQRPAAYGRVWVRVTRMGTHGVLTGGSKGYSMRLRHKRQARIRACYIEGESVGRGRGFGLDRAPVHNITCRRPTTFGAATRDGWAVGDSDRTQRGLMRVCAGNPCRQIER